MWDDPWGPQADSIKQLLWYKQLRGLSLSLRDQWQSEYFQTGSAHQTTRNFETQLRRDDQSGFEQPTRQQNFETKCHLKNGWPDHQP